MLITDVKMLICGIRGKRVRQGHNKANRSEKKLKKLKESKVGTFQSHSATRRVDLQLAQSSSMRAHGQVQLGEQTSGSVTRRRDRRCRSRSPNVTEQVSEKPHQEGEKMSIRRIADQFGKLDSLHRKLQNNLLKNTCREGE
uniref:Uncharacterized protein n=1 Tax=Solanum tuberosum TaxID=4113 RepID=M1D881_SOLTU